MTTALEQAFPLASNWVAATVRSKLAECGIFLTASTDLSGEDFSIQPWAAVAVYGADGDLELYAYDSADTTTADDGGTSCIVASGRRYKKRIDVIVRDSVLSATTAAEPGAPSLGDAYILTAAPTGTDWSGNAKKVATYTARGWIFRTPFVGMIVYSEDDASFYHYSAAGTWTQGLAAGGFADASIEPKKLFHPFAILKVIDQRNAPPGGTPTEGTMYQVGTSPTGDFASNSNNVARWNAAGAWEFIVPAEGDTIYRLDVSLLYSFRSGVWEPTVEAPSIVQYYYKEQSVSTSATALTNRLSQTIQAAVGQKIRATIHYYIHSVVGGTPTVGLRIDTSGSNVAVFRTESIASGVAQYATYSLVIDVPDASSHNYHITTTSSGAVSNVTIRASFEVFTPN